MRHDAFIFDYNGFIEHIKPIIDTLSHDRIDLIYAEYERICRSIKQENWILHEAGTVLDFDDIGSELTSDDIGYYLLVILSTFLRPSPHINPWGVLRNHLLLCGWGIDLIDLLIEGKNTYILLNPDSAPLAHGVGKDDPYWYKMVPHAAYRCGWLSLDLVSSLKTKLEATKKLYMHHVQQHPESRAYAEQGFNDTLAMLTAAEEAGQGLFMVIS